MRLVILLFITGSLSAATYAFHKERLTENTKTATDDTDTAASSELQISRGEMLYKNHCGVCHESNVHIRNGRKAKSPEDIIYWVTRWSNHLKLDWSAEDKHDVAYHLNEMYYKFNLPDK